MEYKRVKGGEKNIKSGVRWTEEEIEQVYFLYKKLNGVGLHEHNPEIQRLAKQLGRTVRSTEAQSLMFRNLDRSGVYSHGNMNKITKKVWTKYEIGTEVVGIQGDLFEGELISSVKSPSYLEWNKWLVYHFFNERLNGVEIGCFPVTEELFEQISGNEFTFDDFVDSIYDEIGNKDFFSKFQILLNNSTPREYNGRVIRKAIPEYFGFILFLVYSLLEDDTEDLYVSNVYDRINHTGKEYLKDKWEDLNTSISRRLLEPAWENLEDWSINYKKGSLGIFYRYDAEMWQRKYVSRLERHALFNSKRLRDLVDLLIDNGYSPESILDADDWRKFFSIHRDSFGKSRTILDYLEEKSPLLPSMVGFLNSYISSHFTVDTIGSVNSTYRSPPVPLKLCIASLPQWPNDPIEDFYFRAYSYSGELEHDKVDSIEIEINKESKISSYSNPLNINVHLENGLMLSGRKNRYATGKKIFWLSKNHTLDEWIEVDRPSNESTFILVLDEKKFLEVNSLTDIPFSTNPIAGCNFYLVQFRNLDSTNFEKVYYIYNPYNKIDGKISLLGEFTSDFRRTLYTQFPTVFEYSGPSYNPDLTIVSTQTGEEIGQLVRIDESEQHRFNFPEEFHYKGQFKIVESGSKVKSPFNYSFGDLEDTPTNVYPPPLKDHDGNKLIGNYSPGDSLLDIPHDFNRSFDVPKFNSWHSNLFSLFKPKARGSKIITALPPELNTIGDKLLQYISLTNNITTYQLPKLFRELDHNLSSGYSKKLMGYWRNLGYINFQDYGEVVKVTPPSILFLQTNKGLKGFLLGYRNRELIAKLAKQCYELGIEIQSGKHSDYKTELFPTQIKLYDPVGNLKNFHKIKMALGLHFVNDIQNPFNPRFVVYQLACIYTQRSVEEFNAQFRQLEEYTTDHHRKRVYNNDTFSWEETNKEVTGLPDKAVVRYDGFKDNSMMHVYKVGGRIWIIKDLWLAIFSGLEGKQVLMKETSEGLHGYSNLYVPFYLGLPYWIEKGLVLLNGKIPKLEYIKDKPFREYETINNKVLTVLEGKLNQKIKEKND